MPRYLCSTRVDTISAKLAFKKDTMTAKLAIATGLTILLTACLDNSDNAHTTPVADIVFTNGKIYTVNEAQPWAEAMAVKDGEFIAVGSNADVEALAGADTEVVDLDGQFVMPGINDLHHHGVEVSTTGADPDALMATEEQKASPEALLAAIKEFGESRPDAPYIFVEGYPSGMFPGNNLPKELLDEIDKSRPLYVMSSGGHAMAGNSKALELAGITAETVPQEFAVIARVPGSMEPLGTVHERGMELYWAKMTFPSKELIRTGILDHTARINGMGITGVRIAGVMQDQLEVASEMDKAGEINAYHSLAFHWRTSYIARKEFNFDLVREQLLNSENFKTDNIASGVLKYYADGAPASKTAYFLEDYVNDPSNRSNFQMDEELFFEEVAFWTKNGITVMAHSVGDAAARTILNAVEAAQKAHGKNGLRHQMTHAVMVDPTDRERFKQLDMVVGLSPAIAAPMAFHRGYEDQVGKERLERWWPGRGLIDAGAAVMVESDYPVGPDDPWRNMEIWITRMDPYGVEEGTFGLQSAITLEESIRAATLTGAYALYMEDEFGSLENGKRATFIVLNQNLFDIPATDISETEVLQTYFNGRLVYESE